VRITVVNVKLQPITVLFASKIPTETKLFLHVYVKMVISMMG